jgi:hypothetical protein
MLPFPAVGIRQRKRYGGQHFHLLANSSKAIGNIAEGDYKVVAVAQADQPGKTQLTLVPVAATNNTEPFNLFVAQADVKHSGVEVGQIVHAQKQAYGLAFARADKSSRLPCCWIRRGNPKYNPRWCPDFPRMQAGWGLKPY